MEWQPDIAEISIEQRLKPAFNPFPGLRPFGINESHLFFGREGHSNEVLNNLSDNRFCAVIGSSGSGKSSLIYCGVIPIIYGGFITDAGSHWRVITTRPGNNPVDNLARSIVESEKSDHQNNEDIEINYHLTRTILQTSSLGLVEAVKILKKPAYENILLVVDQFEELFRYKRNRQDTDTFNTSEAYVKLFVDAVKQTHVPIYIILTMRSDFIGDCSQFQEFTELINRSNYLVPQMTRENFRSAIEGPVAVAGGSIDSKLVNQLLNEIGDNPDQLPILQHALMRTWDHWILQGNPTKPISLEDYEAIGKMEKALSDHANEAYDELKPVGKEICSGIFKVLTERGSDNRGVRRPSKLSEIAAITQADLNDVIEVIEVFRKAGRSFLTPSYEVPLNQHSVIDISHESLMRIWNKLKLWVEEEAISVQMYQRLSEAANLFQQGKTGLWRPPDLHIAISWRNNQKPTLAWAQRYNPAFERTMVYLETSENEYKAEELNKIKLQKRALRRTRIFALVLGAAAVVSLGFMVYAISQTVEAKKQQQEAERQRIIADEQRAIAENQREEAEKQKQLAIQSEQDAMQQKNIADFQKELAQKNEREANKQKEIARTESDEAKKQRLLADSSAQVAKKQQAIAENASAQAMRLRMLSIAQSMAVKSLQIYEDNDLKALLASQAYLFNTEYEGNSFQADMFHGLYAGLKSKKGIDYNRYRVHTDNVTASRYSADNNYFYTSGNDGLILKWVVSDGMKKPQRIYKNVQPYRGMRISPDGKTAACIQGNEAIQILDLSRDSVVATELKRHTALVNDLVFIDNNKLLSASSDKKIILWKIKENSSEEICNLSSGIKTISYSGVKQKIAAGCDDGSVMIIDLNKKAPDTVLFRDKDNVSHSVVFSKDGTLLAMGDKTGYVRVWNFDSKGLERIAQFKAHNTRISSLSFCNDNSFLASAGYDGIIKIWDTRDYNNPPFVISDHTSWVLSVEFNDAGTNLISCSADKSAMIFPISTSQIFNNLQGMISRNLTKDEWTTYVAKDIPYRKTINHLP